MPLSNPSLWARIEAYRFPSVTLSDGPVSGRARILTFAAALASEERLFPETATRLVAEYRRFAYLSELLPEGLMAPSMLARVRSLHRRDDDEYRMNFCFKCLATTWPRRPDPLVIDPATASRQSGRLYQREFGAPPPADIWPALGTLKAWAI